LRNWRHNYVVNVKDTVNNVIAFSADGHNTYLGGFIYKMMTTNNTKFDFTFRTLFGPSGINPRFDQESRSFYYSHDEIELSVSEKEFSNLAVAFSLSIGMTITRRKK